MESATHPPLVSCIIPVYNGECYLVEALDSIQAQRYRPVEVIVVDDGSTDGTAEVVANYAHPIIYERQDHAGAPAARNRGLDIAKGEFIAFLDADDLWHRHKLERQMEWFRENPELGLCTSHMQNFWIPALKHEEEGLNGGPLTRPQPGTICTLLAKRSVLDEIGGIDPKLVHRDLMDLLVRAKQRGVVHEVLTEVLLFRRIHFDNISRRRKRVVDREDLLRSIKTSLDQRRGQ